MAATADHEQALHRITELAGDIAGAALKPDDDFFLRGGDSLGAVRLSGRARAAGIELSLRDVLQLRTPREMSKAVTARAAPPADEGATGAVEVPLTPIQLEFVADFAANPNHRNVVGVFIPRERLQVDALRRALSRLVARRDSLRLRLRHADGRWIQRLAPDAEIPLEVHDDVPASPEDLRRDRVEALATDAQRRLDLANGPTARAVAVPGLDPASSRLVLIAHHMVADGLSWPLLVDDLRVLYDQECGRPAAPLPGSGSFAAWATGVHRYRHSPAFAAEAEFWIGQPWHTRTRLPVDHPERAAESSAAAEVFEWTSLDARGTAALQAVLRAEPDDLSLADALLAALAIAVDWADGRPQLLKMVGHGRPTEHHIGDAESTTGWLATHYPALLPTTAPDVRSALRNVRSMRRRVTDGGLGYGIARFLGEGRHREHLARAVDWHDAIDFNFIGTVTEEPTVQTLVEVDEPVGRIFPPDHLQQCPVRMTSYLTQGRLETRWMTSGVLWERATIHRLQDRFTAALRQLTGTPGDGKASHDA